MSDSDSSGCTTTLVLLQIVLVALKLGGPFDSLPWVIIILPLLVFGGIYLFGLFYEAFEKASK